MGIFRRKQKSSPTPAHPSTSGAPEAPVPPVELVALVERLAAPCVRIAPGGGPPASATSSYVAGYPYAPDDRAWPTWEDAPMFFLAQVAFADVPALEGFPDHGLLQWFVGADDTMGLTFDESAGTVGFAVRWYDDVTAPSLHAPTDPTPWHEAEAEGQEVYAAIDVTMATALDLAPGRMLPTYEEAADRIDAQVLAAWAGALGEDLDDPAFVWDEFVRGGGGPFPALGGHSSIGGIAEFTQEDPRGHQTYPGIDTPAGRLLIELDAHQFGGWGDFGIGHLFGDPAAVGRGDLSSVRYHWDCT